MMKRIATFISVIRAFPVFIIVNHGKYKEKIFGELEYWGGQYSKNIPSNKHLLILADILRKYPEYRNLLMHRVRYANHDMIGYIIINMLWPKMKSLLIFTEDIGFNLFIQHGVGTVIAAKSIGENCWINQNVTIGYDFAINAPVIKNGVRICCGANVIGDIIVENNAIIGAGSVVIRNVDESQIVVGVPSRVVGENNEHQLYKSMEVIG